MPNDTRVEYYNRQGILHKRCARSQLLLSVAIFCVAQLVFVGSNMGQTVWINASGGSFHTPANWTLGVPGSGESAIFNLGETYTVQFNAEVTNSSAFVLNGTTTFQSLAGAYHEYSLTDDLNVFDSQLFIGGPAANSGMRIDIGDEFDIDGGGIAIVRSDSLIGGGDLYVGRSGSGVLTLSNSSGLSNSQFSVGANSGGSGLVTVTGDGSFISTSVADVGLSGTGTLIVENDAHFGVTGHARVGVNSGGEGTLEFRSGSLGLVHDNLTIGEASGSDGMVRVIGSSTLTVYDDIFVGDAGNGGLDIVTGGVTAENVIAGNQQNTGTISLTDRGTLAVEETLIIGANASGTLNVGYQSFVSSQLTRVGNEIGGNGQINVEDGNFSTNNATIGFSGTGAFNVSGQSDVSVENFTVLGQWGSGIGSLTLDGTNSTWSTSSLYVGIFGEGNLTVNNGGRVDVESSMILADSINSNGLVDVSGTNSRVEVGERLRVGLQGDATMRILNGGQVTSLEGIVGETQQGNGNVLIRGTGSEWQSTLLTVGESGLGTINIENRGSMTASGLVFLGDEETGEGTLNISGEGSSFSSDSNMRVGHYGSGSLTIDQGGNASVDSILLVASFGGSTGDILVTGADSRLDVSDTFYTGTGGIGEVSVLDQGVISSDHAVIGSSSNSDGLISVSGAGSTLDVSNFLNVSNSGQGTLAITDGGTVNSLEGRIGRFVGGVGTTIVDGSNSAWNVGTELNVGSLGNGTLTVQNAGRVSTATALIGNDVSGEGTVMIDGDGSLFEVSGDLTIGNNGPGSLIVGQGGNVNSQDGYVGRTAGSSGAVLISNADSDWNVAGNLYVGDDGSGQMGISDGGLVNTTATRLGNGVGSIGLTDISGPGSRWINSTSMHIGNLGYGELVVQDRGIVQTNSIQMGAGTAGNGQVIVTGNNSMFNVATNLDVGGFGQGLLTINDGGLVTASQTSLGQDGRIQIDGGRLEFGPMSYNDYVRVEAIQGSMQGHVELNGFTNAGLGQSPSPGFSFVEVQLENNGTIYGTGFLNGNLHNRNIGQVRLLDEQFIQVAGDLVNDGELNNFGGLFGVSLGLQNSTDGFIGGRGIIDAQGGISNQGVMAFSGTTELLGDLEMLDGGVLVTSGGSTTTIFDDLIHNGEEIRTGIDSRTVIFGSASGAGDFTGLGLVEFEGDLRPGNSPDAVSFGGDVSFGSLVDLYIELGGTSPGQLDQLMVAGDLALNGNLYIELIDGFLPSAYDEFLIAEVGGILSGQFTGLDHGDLVGSYGGRELFITYSGGDGNDVALFTSVPEPGTSSLMCLLMTSLLLRRRRNRTR